MDNQNQLLEQHQEVVERIRHCYEMIGIIILMGIIIFSSIGLSALKHPDEGLLHAFATLLMCWLVPSCVNSIAHQIGLFKEVVKVLNREIKLIAISGKVSE